MAFRISDFRAEMQGDGARPNLFEVVMAFPTEANTGGAERKLTFMCRAAQLPGSSAGFVSIPYFGREVKFSGNKTFPEWTLTVINDEDFKVRSAFERWMNGMNQNGGNLRIPTFATATSYCRDATVYQFGKTGQRIKAYTFVGAFPVDISPIDLDWSANDTIEEFSVTLQYQTWLSDTTDQQAAGLASIGIL